MGAASSASAAKAAANVFMRMNTAKPTFRLASADATPPLCPLSFTFRPGRGRFRTAAECRLPRAPRAPRRAARQRRARALREHGSGGTELDERLPPGRGLLLPHRLARAGRGARHRAGAVRGDPLPAGAQPVAGTLDRAEARRRVAGG